MVIGDFESAGIEWLSHHVIRFLVEVREPFAGILQSDAGTRLGVPVETRAGVAHFEAEKIAHAPGGCFDHSVVFAVRNSVADRVLDNGLKEKAGDEAVERRRLDFDLDAQAIGKPDLFDGEVVLNDLELLRQRNFFRSGPLQRAFKNGIQVRQHLHGFLPGARVPPAW